MTFGGGFGGATSPSSGGSGGGGGDAVLYQLSLNGATNALVLQSTNGQHVFSVDLSPYANSIADGTLTEVQLNAALQTKLAKIGGTVVTGMSLSSGGVLSVSAAGGNVADINLSNLGVRSFTQLEGTPSGYGASGQVLGTTGAGTEWVNRPSDGRDGRDGTDGNDGAPGRPGADGAPGADAELATDGEFATGTETTVAPTVAQVVGALATKLGKPATDGRTGQVVARAADGSTVWTDDAGVSYALTVAGKTITLTPSEGEPQIQTLTGVQNQVSQFLSNRAYVVGDMAWWGADRVYLLLFVRNAPAGGFGSTWSDATWRNFERSDSNAAGYFYILSDPTIPDASITGAKLVASTIPEAKLAESVENDNILAGTIQEDKLSAAVRTKLNAVMSGDLTHTVKVTRKEGY